MDQIPVSCMARSAAFRSPNAHVRRPAGRPSPARCSACGTTAPIGARPGGLAVGPTLVALGRTATLGSHNVMVFCRAILKMATADARLTTAFYPDERGNAFAATDWRSVGAPVALAVFASRRHGPPRGNLIF